jgi:leucyl aminopeptidase
LTGSSSAPAPSARGRLVPLICVDEASFADWRKTCSKTAAAWADANRFSGQTGAVLALPGPDGAVAGYLCGVPRTAALWDWAQVFDALGDGVYRLEGADGPERATQAALAFALANHRFHKDGLKGRARPRPGRILVWPDGCDRAHVLNAAAATALARDLVSLPANRLGPDALADAAKAVATAFGAEIAVTVGKDLLKKNYPAIHAVGRASATAPRLIDLRWGRPRHPKITLVGKGVTFDTGGLDLKPSGAMKLMKKDMGGAAQILALARMVMAAKLPVRLRVLIPAVENSVAGDAMRPLDVLDTRAGLTVEVGNTDAEGRVILSDALFEAAGERPHLIVDCATLTGAARVALGTELPVMFANDDATADRLVELGAAVDDPLWRLPLWRPYVRHVVAKTADVTNAPDTGTGGAITAALFLERFVNAGADAAEGDAPVSASQSKAACGVVNGAAGVPPWVHVDLMAYNTGSRPGRPEGGEAMGLRALFALIEDRFGKR